ncbi:MAG: HAD family hydrolase [Chloroflexia bacterium]
MKPLKGVILDVDGTLVDSNDAHTSAWVEALQRGGYTVPRGKVRRLIGMGADNLLPEAITVEKESDEGKRLSDAWSEIFKEDYLHGLKAFPSTRELLERMRKDGLKLVVASSAKDEMLETLLDTAGATDLIEGKTSSDDAKNSKPEPDIVKAALDKLGMGANEVLMLGDTPYDIEAAGKLGIGVVALRCGGFTDVDFECAVAIYDDPEDLLENYDKSHLARK